MCTFSYSCANISSFQPPAVVDTAVAFVKSRVLCVRERKFISRRIVTADRGIFGSGQPLLLLLLLLPCGFATVAWYSTTGLVVIPVGMYFAL